jgi:predicted ATPase
MWTRLSIQDFRLLRDVTIDFEPGKPVVLIGPNASGKSSVLQVLELLHRCATLGHDAAVRGLGTFASASKDAARIGSSLDTVDAEEWGRPETRYLHHTFETTPQWGLVHESLSATTSSAGDAATTELLRCDAPNSLTLQNVRSLARDTLENPSGKLSFELVRQGSFYPYLEVLRGALSRIRTYGGFLTAPLWDRAPSETKVSVADGAVLAPEEALDRRGLNLINVLYHLKNGDDTGAWRELMQAFQAEFPFVKDLVFPADRGGRVSLGWWDSRYPGTAFSGHDMSEGMLTYLCLLAAVLSPAPTSVLAFDEPDRHLHPSALRRFVHLVERASEKMAVVVATHSDRLLDALSDPAGSIRVCTPTEQGARIERLDRDALESWRARYAVSELRAPVEERRPRSG